MLFFLDEPGWVFSTFDFRCWLSSLGIFLPLCFHPGLFDHLFVSTKLAFFSKDCLCPELIWLIWENIDAETLNMKSQIKPKNKLSGREVRRQTPQMILELNRTWRFEIIRAAYRLGGAVASWLVRSSPDRAVRVRVLAGNIALCSWALLSQCFSVPTWPVNLMLGV